MFVHADIGTQCYVDGCGGVGWGGVGWGGMITFMLRVKQSDMTKQQQKTLTKASKVLKRPAALKRKQSFLIVGGDNSTESVKLVEWKARCAAPSMLGRISPRNAQVQQFAAKRLLEKPGLMPLATAFAEYRRDRKETNGYSTRSRVSNWERQRLGPMKKRSGRASQNRHHETLIYVVKNAQTHAVPMGKTLNEARVYRTTDRCWFPIFVAPRNSIHPSMR